MTEEMVKDSPKVRVLRYSFTQESEPYLIPTDESLEKFIKIFIEDLKKYLWPRTKKYRFSQRIQRNYRKKGYSRFEMYYKSGKRRKY